MDIKVYTDKDYVPLNDLKAFGQEFIDKTEEYRRLFMEIIPLDDLNFVNIVETPALVKKRYSVNVELKGKIDIQAENNDFILEIAKAFINNKEVKGIHIKDIEKLKLKFEANNNDLTIITNYITKNIDKIIENNSQESLEMIFPELSKFDLEFVKHFNDINLNYTIENYLNVTNCSYETGRKNLERLVELKLFSKTKVGKKFTYKPTQKLSNLSKGGQ